MAKKVLDALKSIGTWTGEDSAANSANSRLESSEESADDKERRLTSETASILFSQVRLLRPARSLLLRPAHSLLLRAEKHGFLDGALANSESGFRCSFRNSVIPNFFAITLTNMTNSSVSGASSSSAGKGSK